MTLKQLASRIKNVAVDTTRVFITQHAVARMKERSVLSAEVYECLQKGRILQQPEEDIKTGHLVCRMEFYGASKNIVVCTALDQEDPDLIVVTVISKG